MQFDPMIFWLLAIGTIGVVEVTGVAMVVGASIVTRRRLEGRRLRLFLAFGIACSALLMLAGLGFYLSVQA